MGNKYIFFYILIIFTISLFIFKLFNLQVLDKSYSIQAEKNSTIKINQYPDRGFIYDRNDKLLVGNKYTYNIIISPKEIEYVDSNLFFNSISLPKEKIRKSLAKISKKRYKTLTLFKNLKEKEYSLLKEFLYRKKGFYVEKQIVRKYIKENSANVLGYIGDITSNILSKNKYYHSGDVIGYSGVEKSYEKDLRGVKGKKYFYINAKRNDRLSYKEGEYDIKAEKGKNINISIDLETQEYAEKLMQGKIGSIVAIEPKTGEILTLVSSPTYNPSLLVGRDRNRNYLELYKTEEKPLYDRSLLAQYPPGSPFKIITGLISLQENTISRYSLKTCNGGYKLRRGKVMKCKCGSGRRHINIVTALERSCNTFFIKSYKDLLGKGRGDIMRNNFSNWLSHIKSFGLNSYYNNDLHTGKKGFIPNKSFYDRYYGKNRWYSTFLLSNAIGQGEILMTPIQMANLAATVANRGYYYTPHIIKKIEDSEIDERYKKKIYTSIDKEHFETVVKGMRRVMTKGTSKWGELKGVDICGKTGTVQNPHGEDHSVFIAFAPKDNPKIAISVIIENAGFGATWAVPTASLIIEKYLNREVKRKWMEEYVIKGKSK